MPTNKNTYAPIAITSGGRKAIGVELLCKAWEYYSRREQTHKQPSPQFFFIGARKEISQFAIPCAEIRDLQEVNSIFARALPVLENNDPLDAIDIAIDSCREKKASAMVTLPVEKEIFAKKKLLDKVRSSDSIGGHTEYLAEKLQVKKVAMLLVAGNLRTSPLTRHISLARALTEVSEQRIIEAARLLHRALINDFAIKKPRLALAALNPHASEGGRCGNEEASILTPALKNLRNQGLAITGPHPADSLFLPSMRKTFDCAITLYHDQGLIPIKLLAFHRAVNVTLGLPIVRTSPDHGTAREIVGKKLANAGSLIAAIALAKKIAEQRAKLVKQSPAK